MALTLEEVRRIAALARLRLSPEEELRFVSQLGKIVDYIDHLFSDYIEVQYLKERLLRANAKAILVTELHEEFMTRTT